MAETGATLILCILWTYTKTNADSAALCTSLANESTDSASAQGRRQAGGQVMNEVKGNLFECPESWSLAHCISQDCRMGKGIAMTFRKKFGGVKQLLNQNKRVGEVAVLKRPVGDSDSESDHRYIYYLITKQDYWKKPTYDSLRQSLVATRDHCCSHGVLQLAMPQIGCGLDRLDWKKVRHMIVDVFADSDVQVTVCCV